MDTQIGGGGDREQEWDITNDPDVNFIRLNDPDAVAEWVEKEITENGNAGVIRVMKAFSKILALSSSRDLNNIW